MRSRRRGLILVLFTVLAVVAGACSGDDSSGEGGNAEASGGGGGGDVVPIRWFVGLGAGTDAPLIPAQEAIVEEFNATHDNIELTLEVAPDAEQAATLMQTQVAGGNPPDIAGPVGVKGAAQFEGGWLDLTPYLEDVDLSDFDPALIEFWNQQDVQLGLPFAVFPQVMWFNKALFDEAGLAYPPQEFGAPYVDADGNERPWNIDTLRELSMELTVDANGLTPLDDGFSPDERVQWGFGNMLTDFRGIATMFGPGTFVAEDEETCQVPDNWVDAAAWYHDAMWVDYFHPDPIFGESEILGSGGNWFGSGNLAMGAVHTWYADWGTADLNAGFDIAAMPAASDGTVTAKLHADTFAIPAGTDNPDEAVEVLLWMMSPEIAPKLASVYGGLPALEGAQQTYVDDPANNFGFTWATAQDALQYPDQPSHEGWWPNYVESSDALVDWWTVTTNDPSADAAAEVQAFCDELQPIFDRA